MRVSNFSVLLLVSSLLFVMSGCTRNPDSVAQQDTKIIASEVPVVAGFSEVDLALFQAVRSGTANDVQRFIDQGANVNARRRPWNMSPLLLASDKHPDIARALVKAGADVNVADRDGATVLMKAVQADNVEVAKLVLENGAKTEVRDHFDETALVYAVVLGRTKIVEMLIKHGADVNVVRYNGETPLILAKRNAGYAKTFNVPVIMRHEVEHGDDNHHKPMFITKEQLAQERQQIVAVMEKAGAKAITTKVKRTTKAHH